MRFTLATLAFLASLVYVLLVAEESFAVVQQVEQSKANAIAENMKVIRGTNGFWFPDDFPDVEKWNKKRNDTDIAFLELTSSMIEKERERQANLAGVLWWANLSGLFTCVLAHVFLILGFCLGTCELLRAYRLRRMGVSEPAEIKLGLEGAALKGSFYGFLVFGTALVFYFAYLQFVYPVTSVG